MQENAALDQHNAVSGNTVAPTGLHLFPCGFLGSSPDCIITEGPAIGSFHLKTVQKFQFCNPPSQNLLICGTHEDIHEV